jgi:hypothetical protein
LVSMMKKILLSFSLLVSATMLAQQPIQDQKNMHDVVAQIKKDGTENKVAQIIKAIKVFDMPLRHITSLDGIDRVPGIESALVIRVPINSIRTIKAGTFKSQKFKNLLVLDLGQNLLEELEPGAFEGLENLKMLLLNDNNLISLQQGVLSGLSKLKIISIGNNPRPSFARRMSAEGQAEEYRKKAAEELKMQVKQQAPKALIYAGAITRQFMQRAVIIIGAVAAVAGVIWYAFFKTKPVEGKPQEPAAEEPAAGLDENWLIKRNFPLLERRKRVKK